MKNLIKNRKNWLTGLLIATISILALDFIFTMIVYSTKDYISGTTYFQAILNSLIYITFFAFALYAIVKDENFWSKVFYVTYFSFVFLSNLFGFSNTFSFLALKSTIHIFYGLGLLLDSLAIIAIGICYILYLAQTIKNENVVEVLCIVRFVIIFINFVIGICAIAEGMLLWNSFLNYFLNAVITMLFLVASKDKN